MTRIPATIAWVGGLAAVCAVFAAAWHWAERPPELASAAIGPGTDARGCWPKGFSDGAVAAEIGDRSGVNGAPASDPEFSVADAREALPLLPIPQADVAWEPPLANPLDRGDGCLEVDEECRPIQVTKTSRLGDREKAAEDREEAAATGAVEGEPTLAPPPPPESDAGRRVIRVVVEAEQAARKQDAHQP